MRLIVYNSVSLKLPLSGSNCMPNSLMSLLLVPKLCRCCLSVCVSWSVCGSVIMLDIFQTAVTSITSIKYRVAKVILGNPVR